MTALATGVRVSQVRVVVVVVTAAAATAAELGPVEDCSCTESQSEIVLRRGAVFGMLVTTPIPSRKVEELEIVVLKLTACSVNCLVAPDVFRSNTNQSTSSGKADMAVVSL